MATMVGTGVGGWHSISSNWTSCLGLRMDRQKRRTETMRRTIPREDQTALARTRSPCLACSITSRLTNTHTLINLNITQTHNPRKALANTIQFYCPNYDTFLIFYQNRYNYLVADGLALGDYNFNSMRLQFQLKKIKIDPVCHVQLLRHAEEFQGRNNINGQLYGALLDDEAEVTSVLPLPDGEKTTKEELEAMEKRNDDLLTNFNQDTEKIGWYLVCYTRNFWDSLETIKYYESYINTSFFLVLDYKARLEGQNPYRAFRLKDQFALKESFKWQQLQRTSLEQDNPFEEIPVEVAKNDLFELMMLFNKDNFLKGFTTHRKHQNNAAFDHIKQNIEEYLTAFEEREDVQKYLNQNYLKPMETVKPEDAKDRTIPFNDYCQYIGQALKLDNYDLHFKQYLHDNEHYERLFEDTN